MAPAMKAQLPPTKVCVGIAIQLSLSVPLIFRMSSVLIFFREVGLGGIGAQVFGTTSSKFPIQLIASCNDTDFYALT